MACISRAAPRSPQPIDAARAKTLHPRAVRTLLHFARRYLIAYLPWYAVGVLCLAATNWLSVTIPLYLAQGIDALGRPDGSDAVWRATWSVAGMGLAVIVVRTISRLLFFTPGRLVEGRVRDDLFHRMLLHQPSFMSRWPTGDLVSRLTSDINMVRLLAGFTALGIINTALALVMTTTQMVRISPRLALLMALPLTIGFIATLASVGRLRALMMELQEHTAALSDHVLSTYQGIPTLHAFGAEATLTRRFDEHADRWLDASIRRANLRVVIGPALALAASVDVYLLIAMGGPMALAGEVSVGEIVALTSLVAYLTGPLRGMSFILSLFKQSQASLERIDALMNEPLDRPEGGHGIPPTSAPTHIEARGLSFRYPGATVDALSDVNVSVPAGGTLGVFGATGSGKTTLLKLIVRLVNPPRGTLWINDVDAIDLDLDAWRRVATLVPQRAFLFSESIRDNVELGGDDPTALAVSLRRATLDVDVKTLPQGAETIVGEAGLTLSGGQRQRTALARGLYRGGGLLLLDDVLSAVDHHTEHQLIDGIRAQSPRPTTVIAAHRLSALAHADVIVVLERGRMIDSGRHEELIQREGPYRETWLRQSEGQEAP